MKQITTLFILGFFLFLLGMGNAQTALSAGDVAIVGLNCDNPDEFAFVLLVDISTGTEINFTDNGVKSDGTFRGGEGTVTWTSSSATAAGTIIDIENDGGWTASGGSVAASGSFALSSGGDQIIAYTGSESNPTFIYALNDEKSGWQADATTSNSSALPPGLSDGLTAVALEEVDNAVYNDTLTSGTQTELLTAISNKDNWNGDNSNRQTMPSGPYTVTGGGVDTPPSISNVNQDPVSPTSSDAVTVTATVTDDHGLTSVLLKYDAGSGYTDVTMYDDGAHGDGAAGDSVFGGSIPPQSDQTQVNYYISATDDASQTTTNPDDAPSSTYSYTVNDNPSVPGDIVINEIMYNSIGTDTEYVELFNTTDHTVDMSNWTFKDNDDNHSFVFPEGTVLASQEYLVLCHDTTEVKEKYAISNVLGNFSFALNNSGDQTRLFDNNGVLMDSVQYDDAAPWPTAADGDGPSLELVNPSYDNSLAENWAASSGEGTPGGKNSQYVNVVIPEENALPSGFALYPNYPNPFGRSISGTKFSSGRAYGTVIRYHLPRAVHVRLTVYNTRGQVISRLVDREQRRGTYNISFNARDLASGMYFYELQAGSFRQIRKMIRIK